jgi:redox-sensitive bicupin YhaK (pirin superfamily)
VSHITLENFNYLPFHSLQTMNVTLLEATRRGIMQNREFKGYPLFSNGVPGTGRLDRFGAVYVFNDDYLFPKSGLGLHPHANVEIITVMVTGQESHEDNLGYHQILSAGSVQLISAGIGMQHAGGNVSDSEDSRHLQIWVAPHTKNTKPTVQLYPSPASTPSNEWRCEVSPDGQQGSLTIQQDVWLFQGRFAPGTVRYALQRPGHGVLIYVLEGTINLGNVAATQEDTFFITDVSNLEIMVTEAASLLLIETLL